MQWQLLIVCAFAVALAVTLLQPMLLSPDVLLQLHGINVSDTTRVHVHGAVRSAQRMILALPCLVPWVSALPLICAASFVKNWGKPSCFGAISLLFDQEALVKRLVYHTIPTGDFLTPLSSAIDIIGDVLAAQGDGRVSCLNTSISSHDILPLVRRSVTGMYDLTEHMRLSISRYVDEAHRITGKTHTAQSGCPTGAHLTGDHGLRLAARSNQPAESDGDHASRT